MYLSTNQCIPNLSWLTLRTLLCIFAVDEQLSCAFMLKESTVKLRHRMMLLVPKCRIGKISKANVRQKFS